MHRGGGDLFVAKFYSTKSDNFNSGLDLFKFA